MSKWPIDRPRKRKVSAKLVAVAWILFLELLVATYVYTAASGGPQTPISFVTSSTTSQTTTAMTTTTTTSAKPVDAVKVTSPSITNDTLSIDVHNLGPNSTDLLTIQDICTPKFQICYPYASFGGTAFKTTFLLPAKQSFDANLSGICVMPIPSCRRYLPIANATYFLVVQFGYTDGSTVSVHVKAEDTNTWAPYPTAILGINQTSLTIVPANLTAYLNVTVGANSSLPYASWTTSLDGYLKPNDAYSGVLMTNETGCEGFPTFSNYTIPNGALNYTASCIAPVQVAANFTTVLTGVNTGDYLALTVKDTTVVTAKGIEGLPDANKNAVIFAEWLEAKEG